MTTCPDQRPPKLMNNHAHEQSGSREELPAQVTVEGRRWKVFTSGPALFVIAIIAVLGVILLAFRITDLATQAIKERGSTTRVDDVAIDCVKSEIGCDFIRGSADQSPPARQSVAKKGNWARWVFEGPGAIFSVHSQVSGSFYFVVANISPVRSNTMLKRLTARQRFVTQKHDAAH